MKAKLVRIYQPSNRAWYFKTYVYECIECGTEFTRHQYNDRISPYCVTCNRIHSREKQQLAKINRENLKINKLLDDITDRIADLDQDGCNVYYTDAINAAIDVISDFRR